MQKKTIKQKKKQHNIKKYTKYDNIRNSISNR